MDGSRVKVCVINPILAGETAAKYLWVLSKHSAYGDKIKYYNNQYMQLAFEHLLKTPFLLLMSRFLQVRAKLLYLNQMSPTS